MNYCKLCDDEYCNHVREELGKFEDMKLQVEALAGALQRLRLALREETKGGLRMSLNLAGAFGNAIAMIREFAPAWDGVEHVSKSEKKVEDKQ